MTTVRQSSTVGPSILKDQHGFQGSIVPVNPKSEDYTTVLADTGGAVLHPAADDNARTFTIAANADVPYELGAAIVFINQANTLSIAIAGGDTLTLSGGTSTGTRALAAYGIATAFKTDATGWIISGSNLT